MAPHDDTSSVTERFIVEQVRPEDPFTLVLTHSTPGKGAAVRHGMLMGQGDYLFICDADLAMPIEEIAKFLPPALERGAYDIAIASREAPGAERIDEPVYRHVMGRVFNFLVRVLAVRGIQDTQCGFKMFTRESAHLTFPLQKLDGWSFDVEVLYIARRHNLRLVEIPIRWYYQTDSRVRPMQDTVNMVRELLKIRRNGRQGMYDGGAPAPVSTRHLRQAENEPHSVQDALIPTSVTSRPLFWRAIFTLSSSINWRMNYTSARGRMVNT